VSVFVAKFRVTESGRDGAAKRRFYDRSKVPGERASRTTVSTTQLAFENSRLECLQGGTVYTILGRAYLDGMEKARRGGIFVPLHRRAYGHVRASHASHRNN